MRSICVYCGSNAGSKPVYTERAIALGTRIAQESLALVYGGGNVGLMGVVADAVLEAGGEVIGVIPEQLVSWEVAHKGVTRLEVVGNMGLKFPVQGADHAGGALAGLGLGLRPHGEGRGFVDHIGDVRQSLQEHVADLAGLFNRAQLRRVEDRFLRLRGREASEQGSRSKNGA